MTVEEMLARISSAELTEWAAYEQLHGHLGARRLDALFAQLCAVVANSNSGKKGKRSKPEDFLPQWGKRSGGSQDWRQMQNNARGINAAFGGTVNGQPTKPESKRRGASRTN